MQETRLYLPSWWGTLSHSSIWEKLEHTLVPCAGHSSQKQWPELACARFRSSLRCDCSIYSPAAEAGSRRRPPGGARAAGSLPGSRPQPADPPLGGAVGAPGPLPLPGEGWHPLGQPLSRPGSRRGADRRGRAAERRALSPRTRRVHRSRTRASGHRYTPPPRRSRAGVLGSLSPVSTRRGWERCPPGPAAVPGAAGRSRSRPSGASRPRWACCGPPPRRRSTWTWTNSRCTAAPRAATSATRWTSIYLPLARKSPGAGNSRAGANPATGWFPARLPGDPRRSPQPDGRRLLRFHPAAHLGSRPAPPPLVPLPC